MKGRPAERNAVAGLLLFVGSEVIVPIRWIISLIRIILIEIFEWRLRIDFSTGCAAEVFAGERGERVMDVHKIGFLTYRKLDELAHKAVEKLNDPEVEVVFIEGLMENLIDRVDREMKRGVDVFVAGGANARFITKYTSANVVNIKHTFYDYFKAILKAKEISDTIGLVSYLDHMDFDDSKIEKSLGIKLERIHYDNKENLRESLKKTDAGVIIGASLANEVAGEVGVPSILIYPGVDSVIETINEAKSISKVIREEKERSKIFQSVLEFSPNGVIVTDRDSNILFFNPAVEKLFDMDFSKARGEELSEILPECTVRSVLESGETQLSVINRVRNRDVLVNRIPLEVEKNIIGSLIMVEKISELQKREQKIRISNNEKGFSAKNHYSNIIGNSEIIRELVEETKLYARTHSNILITGETGTGKEIFAQSIHNYSLVYNGPFVAVNCAAIPANLLESELFGYDEGAFTGSKAGGKAGFFEIAHNGTIFLDEIGELPLSLQSRLLRVIQEREVIRVGGDRVIPINVRIIAATNKNLLEKIPDEFRMDLYYRLNVLELEMPPLRKRGDDVVEIFKYFISKNKSLNTYKTRIPEEVYGLLKFYSWPGNIREMENVCERFSLFLPRLSRHDENAYKEILVKAIGETRIVYDLFKKHGCVYSLGGDGQNYNGDLIKDLLIVFSGRKNKVAEILGIGRTTLWRILKTFQNEGQTTE